jgi:hypothetical protein
MILATRYVDLRHIKKSNGGHETARRDLSGCVGMRAQTRCVVGILLAVTIASVGPARLAVAGNILFLGNSITRHGPDPSLQWAGDWGMAASRADLDFVSLTLGQVRQATHSAISGSVVSASHLEQEFYQLTPSRVRALLAGIRQPVMIVVQLGDNVDLSGDRASGMEFAQQYGVLLAGLRERFGTAARLACIGKWWPAPSIDFEIQMECSRAGGSYVDLADVYSQPWSNASSERAVTVAQVGAHPGDRAMREIANRVAAALIHPQLPEPR